MKLMKLILMTMLCVAGSYSCKSVQVVMEKKPPEIQLSLNTEKIVLVDLAKIQARGLVMTKQREEVLQEIKQFYFKEGSKYLADALSINVVVDTTKHSMKTPETVVQEVQQTYGPALVILVNSFDGGFNQETVNRERNNDGSVSKTAQYSVYCTTDVSIWYNNQFYPKRIEASKPHSERSVMSGLLARGPGYRANKRDIEEAAKANMVMLADVFRETKRPVIR
jgi:hypothetical protein